ncbi:MAG: substrate-binding domain-containing protein [Rhodobacteraceae bacterium]|nr:substrate-binding domain-containing protein [Paracoccaceae bacterium]
MKQLVKMTIAAAALAVGATSAMAEGLDEINPETAKMLYNPELIDPAQPVGVSMLRDFKAKKPPPWKIGYASSYAGNTWRAGAMDHLQNVVIPKWKELGMISEVVVTQSNLDDATQIQQIRQLVDQGVDAILVCCSNPTALNETVKYAYDRGVPTVSFTGYLTEPHVINTSVNFQVAGLEIGKRMADELGGKGNVLVVEGIPGTSTSDSQDRGIKAGLETAKGIKIAGSIAGMWTDQIAQGEVQKWIATHPGKLGGIVVQSAAEMGVIRAIKQSGRKGVKIAVGGELGALCTWRKNPDLITAAVQTWPPGDEIEMAVDVLMRVMQGQGPKIQSILSAPKVLSYDDMAKLVPEDCDESNGNWLNMGKDGWAPDSYLDQFFDNPADPTKYKP